MLIPDLEAILVSGGAPRIDLLRHAVKSITMELLLLFVAREYRFRPTRTAAIALYDMFCAPDAPARIRTVEAIPPRELRLAAAVHELRRQETVVPPAENDEPLDIHTTTPSFELFAGVVEAIRADVNGILAALAERYDPTLTPEQNLPDGRMTAAQRQFVDTVWRPRVRPKLVSVGFWQLSTID